MKRFILINMLIVALFTIKVNPTNYFIVDSDAPKTNEILKYLYIQIFLLQYKIETLWLLQDEVNTERQEVQEIFTKDLEILKSSIDFDGKKNLSDKSF